MRIRSVKPSFMRHEELQDLEVAHPGKYIMLVFQGLWMLSDSKGKFEYKPKHMKLEILPFIPFNLQETLNVLEEAGFFKTYEVNNKKYGIIPTFLDHQRINGKEKADGEKYPYPAPVKADLPQGSTGEATENQERSQEEEREREEERELGKGTDNAREEEIKLVKKIIKDFGFNEISSPDKIRTVDAFIQKIKNSGRLEYFQEQYDNYFLFKNRYGERKHGFTGFFGKQENAFEDGKWDESNWGNMITDFENKPNGTTAKQSTSDKKQSRDQMGDQARGVLAAIADKYGGGCSPE